MRIKDLGMKGELDVKGLVAVIPVLMAIAVIGGFGLTALAITLPGGSGSGSSTTITSTNFSSSTQTNTTVSTNSSSNSSLVIKQTVMCCAGGGGGGGSPPHNVKPDTPVGTLAQAVVEIYNNQSSATAQGFQQLITIPAGTYLNYEAANLQNVEFTYLNGTVIPSWLENGTASTKQVYWLKINQIGANSTLYLYMNFLNESTNLLSASGAVGEAPQLSPTYGEYDNGAEVFNFYDNFAGSSLDSKWTGSGSFSVKNGLSLQSSSSSDTYVKSVQTFNSLRSILEFYGTFTAPSGTIPIDFGLGSIGTPKKIALYWEASSGYFNAVTATTSGSTTFAKDTTVPQRNFVFGLYTTAVPDAHAFYTAIGTEGSPTNQYKTASTVYGNTNSITVEDSQLSGVGMNITFVRIRDYPPLGFMPSVTLYQAAVFSLTPSEFASQISYGTTNYSVQVTGPPEDYLEVELNGHVVAGPSSGGTLTYTLPIVAVGSYNITGLDINASTSQSRHISVIKAAPQLILSAPQSFNYNGNPISVSATIVTVGNQLSSSLYDNGILLGSSSTKLGPINLGSSISQHNLVLTTPGDANYINSTTILFTGIYPGTSTLKAGAIKHVIIIIQENHAFDNYFGTYPGVSYEITPSTCLPYNTSNSLEGCLKPGLNTNPIDTSTPTDDYGPSHVAWNNGLMNGFLQAQGAVPCSGGQSQCVGASVASYYNNLTIPYYWDMARNYTLMDGMFSGTLSYSLPNHWDLIAGQSPSVAIYNTIFNGSSHNANQVLLNAYLSEAQQIYTLPQELTTNSISWKYYGATEPSNYTSALQSNEVYYYWDPLYSQNISYTASYRQHFAVSANIFIDIQDGALSNVSWVTPPIYLGEHPPASVLQGSWYTSDIVDQVMNSQYWNNTVIIIVWDTGGGYFDLAPPPTLAGQQLGFRVPGIVISPYAKKNYIDSTTYSFESTMKFIEQNWGLSNLTSTDGSATDILNSLDFNQTPSKPDLLPLNQTQLNIVNDYLPSYQQSPPISPYG